VVVDNLDVKRFTVFPSKAYAPLLVDADAELPLAIALYESSAEDRFRPGGLSGRCWRSVAEAQIARAITAT